MNRPRSPFLAGTLLAALIVAAGCAPSRQPDLPPPATAASVRALCGTTPCLTADLMARIATADGKAGSVEVAVRRRGDGRLRLDLARLDVVGVRLLATEDGALEVWLPRDGTVARERPVPAAGLGVLNAARLLAQELAEGPLPAGEVQTTEDGLRQRDPATGLDARITLDAATGLPAIRRLLAPDGRELLRIAYERWKRFETVQRPERCTLTITDGPRIHLRLVRLRPVAAIATGGLSLNVPADVRIVTLDQLGDILAPQVPVP